MSRRQARETALQVMFAFDIGNIEKEQIFPHITEEFKTSAKAQEFAQNLVDGTILHLEKIDTLIAQLTKGWDIKRLAAVDRNIMRLALYEIFYCGGIPPAVSVNEAVEIAKIFGGEKSGSFVNGILGHVVENLDKYRPMF